MNERRTRISDEARTRIENRVEPVTSGKLTPTLAAYAQIRPHVPLRRRKLCPETIALAAQYLAEGCTIENTAQLCTISRRTLLRWLEVQHAHEDGEPLDEELVAASGILNDALGEYVRNLKNKANGIGDGRKTPAWAKHYSALLARRDPRSWRLASPKKDTSDSEDDSHDPRDFERFL